jgi:hypothetical protein
VSATGAQVAELAEARQRRAVLAAYRLGVEHRERKAALRARLAELAAAPSPPQRLRHLKVVPS